MTSSARGPGVFAVVEQIFGALPSVEAPEMMDRLFHTTSAALGVAPARGWLEFVAQVRVAGAASDATAVLLAALILVQRATFESHSRLAARSVDLAVP
jgi:hypothetical protein